MNSASVDGHTFSQRSGLSPILFYNLPPPQNKKKSRYPSLCLLLEPVFVIIYTFYMYPVPENVLCMKIFSVL